MSYKVAFRQVLRSTGKFVAEYNNHILSDFECWYLIYDLNMITTACIISNADRYYCILNEMFKMEVITVFRNNFLNQ